MSIKRRKKDHIKIAERDDITYSFSSGFERFHFIHNSLPEIDFDRVEITIPFLNKKINPIIISGMTGGYARAKDINKRLASVAEEYSFAFGLGSQRAMIENPSLTETYLVRDVAPSIPIIANIGGVQLKDYTKEKIEDIVSKVDADALAIHLNPLQELVQPEGDRDFTGVLGAIEKTVEFLSVPVIVKETGAGISQEVAKKLKGVGVSYVDVSGAGGTSWSKIEEKRGGIKGFGDWGIPTALSVKECSEVIDVIASGGIKSGVDGAKALALGAKLFGIAREFLLALKNGKEKDFAELLIFQLKGVCFLTGCREISELIGNRSLLFEL